MIFTTHSIDTAAAVVVVTSQEPEIRREPGAKLQYSFAFTDNPTIQSTVKSYAAGALMVPAQKFADVRSWLFRELKRRKEGGR